MVRVTPALVFRVVLFCWPWSCLSCDLSICVCPFVIFEFLFPLDVARYVTSTVFFFGFLIFVVSSTCNDGDVKMLLLELHKHHNKIYHNVVMVYVLSSFMGIMRTGRNWLKYLQKRKYSTRICPTCIVTINASFLISSYIVP